MYYHWIMYKQRNAEEWKHESIYRSLFWVTCWKCIHINVDSLLNFLDYRKFKWEVTISETHPLMNNQIKNGDLFDGIDIISGHELEKLLKHNEYYSIFLTLRGFPLSCTNEVMKKTVINQFKWVSQKSMWVLLFKYRWVFPGIFIKGFPLTWENLRARQKSRIHQCKTNR